MEDMKLYEIIPALAALVDDETGEIMDPDAFEELSMARDEKLEGLGMIIKNRAALIDELKAEKKRIAERIETLANQNEGTKSFLDSVLDGHKFETARVRCSYRKSKAVEIVEENEIPEKFLNTKTVTTPDKTAIKEAIVSGELVPGCNLRENNNLSVK